MVRALLIRRQLFHLVVAAGVSLLASQSSASSAAGLLVIANSGVQLPGAMPIDELSAIYLLRLTNWPDGSHIVPVNREASSALREKFNRIVLKQDAGALATYWNKMHFLGKDPPVVQESEQSMLAFVQNVPGAIGYISGSTPPQNVKVLMYVP